MLRTGEVKESSPVLTSTKNNFPLDYVSAASMVKFSGNLILFKIEYMNRERFETAQSAASVLGKAFHYALQVYYGGIAEWRPETEAQAIEYGLRGGLIFLEMYNEGFINFTTTLPNKQKMMDALAFAYNAYVQQMPYEPGKVLSTEEEIIEAIDIEWRGQRLRLPVPLKGILDRVWRDDGKLKVTDYKTCYQYSNPEKIDGAKILQAVEYYLLTYAKYGEPPYSITFEECKYTKNSDGGKQVRSYEVVYDENPLYFEFYFRFYEDMIRALNGEMVYVPNVTALFDNEVAIIAYIHRLDVQEETAKKMKQMQVTNITDLLKKEIQNAGNMRKLMKQVEARFAEAKNIDYTKMTNEQKIQTKLMEHGMMLQFNDIVRGAQVDLYRFTPSIGIKMSRLPAYVADVEQVLGVSGVRVLAPIPDSTMIGFEIPRKDRAFPAVPAGQGFEIAIGQTTDGQVRRFDVREAPHILIAGASGSGKSVLLSSLIGQIAGNENVELHLFDPKEVELAHHKRAAKEYQSDYDKINFSLQNLVREMNARYAQMAKAKVRNIDGMNGAFPYKFVFIDEFGDLILADRELAKMDKKAQSIRQAAMRETAIQFARRAAKEGIEFEPEVNIEARPTTENLMLRLAQKARAAGIHLIISTQSPRVEIVSGLIKANFPTKIVLKTAKATDSQVVIDQDGAEKLLGKGDMLFAGDRGIERLQGYNA